MSRFFMVGLPHTPFSESTTSCAFTHKAAVLAKMLHSVGREVVTMWGGDLADVSLMSVEDQHRHFGEWSADALPNVIWDRERPEWVQLHDAAIRELRARLEPGDIIGLIGGSISQCIVDEFGADYTIAEPTVGYDGPCRTGTFWCTESYAHLHVLYGRYGIGDGRPFDVVIPNAVDPDEWEMAPSSGYALFVGRLIARKGPHVAAQIAKAAGLPLLLAGAGVASQEPGRIVATDGTVIEGDVLHVGAVSGEMRRQLFAGAEVLICPTLYIGPWEGVHAEAMMSGVPVAASAWGAFTETLPAKQLFRSLRQATEAIHDPVWPRGQAWRDHAIELCGIDVCAEKYRAWFDRLDDLRNGRNGWYAGFDESGRPLS